MKNGVYLITDTHFGHAKMPIYCGRPLDFAERILKNLKQVTANGGTLIHLGDICFGKDEMWHKRLIEATSKCDKRILIRGNHDKKSSGWYMDHGWTFVCDAFISEYYGKKILFSHAPMHHGEVDLHIHGHFHNKLPRFLSKEFQTSKEEYWANHNIMKMSSKSRLMAIEYTDYKPVRLDKFITQEPFITIK